MAASTISHTGDFSLRSEPRRPPAADPSDNAAAFIDAIKAGKIGHGDVMVLNAEGGPLDYYFIYGPTPKQVVEGYAYLTGKPPLPPLWALGFQQSRYSYTPESKLREIATRLRNHADTRPAPQRDQWVGFHTMTRLQPQAPALRDGREQEDALGPGETFADADSCTASKWKIGKLGSCAVFHHPALW